MRAHEAFNWLNKTGTLDASNAANQPAGATGPVVLEGGVYSVSVIATFGGGNVALKQLGPDNATYIDVKQSFDDGSSTIADLVIGSFSANGQKIVILPPGRYHLLVTTATAVYANIVRCPGD